MHSFPTISDTFRHTIPYSPSRTVGGTYVDGASKQDPEKDTATSEGKITEKWKRLNNKILIKHYSTDQIKKNETIGASGTMRERKYIHSFGTETQGKENT